MTINTSVYSFNPHLFTGPSKSSASLFILSVCIVAFSYGLLTTTFGVDLKRDYSHTSSSVDKWPYNKSISKEVDSIYSE